MRLRARGRCTTKEVSREFQKQIARSAAIKAYFFDVMKRITVVSKVGDTTYLQLRDEFR